MTLPLAAFEACGIEIEYMIVDRESLAVRPMAERVLSLASGRAANEIERGPFCWSNELVAHVIELKVSRPSADLAILPGLMQAEVAAMDEALHGLGARLMPTAMHPFMNPRSQTQLWSAGNTDIYRAYDRIFDCQTHGWANLQSVHINLPFRDDAEFARLHAAIRLVLPILPALAASSPIADGALADFLDYRMVVYRDNAAAIPSITGQVIPETVTSRADYEACILAPMYAAIAPHDRAGLLRHEWLNSRGAIARFERNAIEIRVVDVQECPLADIAIAAASVDLTRMLYDGKLAGQRGREALQTQPALPTDALAAILSATVRDGDEAVIDHTGYLGLLGYAGERCTAAELWRHLVVRMEEAGAHHAGLWREPLAVILAHGPLARRIVAAVGPACAANRLRVVYRELCDCLYAGRMFL